MFVKHPEEEIDLKRALLIMMDGLQKAAEWSSVPAKDALQSLRNGGFPIDTLADDLRQISNPIDVGFFYWDETWAHPSYPFPTYTACKNELNHYIEHVLEGMPDIDEPAVS